LRREEAAVVGNNPTGEYDEEDHNSWHKRASTDDMGVRMEGPQFL
jgi:hypothetical protein